MIRLTTIVLLALTTACTATSFSTPEEANAAELADCLPAAQSPGAIAADQACSQTFDSNGNRVTRSPKCFLDSMLPTPPALPEGCSLPSFEITTSDDTMTALCCDK
jgi:hypothetical protein